MPILEISALIAKENGITILNNIFLTISSGQQIAVTGPSGSGKTTLLHCIAGKHSYTGVIVFHTGGERGEESHPGNNRYGNTTKIVLVEQHHRFKNLSNTSMFYYQQRFNSFDSEDSVTVEEELKRHLSRAENDSPFFTGDVMDILQLLHLETLQSAKLIQLSNGENKRLQIAKALLLKPAILLLDNPFIGLDKEARETLLYLLDKISTIGIHLVVVTPPHQFPSCITHVLALDRDGTGALNSIDDFRNSNRHYHSVEQLMPEQELLNMLTLPSIQGFEFAVRMINVTIEYGSRRILDNVCWEIRRGEKWSLTGPNGAGKSTLLSLINADNPQASANEIYLFDRRRGTGESIWDIKKKIGYVSPELHTYFDADNSCFEVVASGLFDTIGLFRLLTEAQEALVLNWMKVLQIERLINKYLYQVSHSEQRLVLLARALVKNPSLLILDEPCQGLDINQISLFKKMVNAISIKSGNTLIYVSHYPDEIPDCVDKFLRLDNGKIS